MIKAVIFDVDGTLVDSNDFHVKAWQRAFRHYGKELGYDELHSQIGKGGDQLLPVFCSPHELESYGAALEQLRGEMFARDYLPIVQPFPHVRSLFERIKADGMRIALASSAKEEELEQHKKTLKVESLIDATTSADDVERSKPKPDIFQAVLAKLGDVRSNEAIVVGDTPYDALAARRAGMAAIGVLSGGFSIETLHAENVIALYRDVADLLAHYAGSPLARKQWATPNP